MPHNWSNDQRQTTNDQRLTVMKRFAFFFLALASLAIVMDSCMPEAQSTPMLYSSILYRTNGPLGRDTLHLTDSLCVGDSLLCPMTLMSQFNNYLTRITATAEQDAFSYWFSCDSDVMAILTEASKPEEGTLFFKEGYLAIPVTFCFVPKKSGTNRVTFVVANTAKEDFSPRTFYFDAIVK